MFKNISKLHWLLLIGGGFIAFKWFTGREETSESIDLVQEAIDDLEQEDDMDDMDPEPEELDEMLQDAHY
jgi:hypothetical protein